MTEKDIKKVIECQEQIIFTYGALIASLLKHSKDNNDLDLAAIIDASVTQMEAIKDKYCE